MVSLRPVAVDEFFVVGIEVDLPGTHLAILTTEQGYIMCGALDIGLLNTRLAERRIVAGRAVGVRTIDELLNASLHDVTDEAARRGLVPGMPVRQALRRLR